MTKHENIDELEVGYDIPASIGMAYEDIQTPCLILDLDALERNVRKMGDYAQAHGMRHRAHGKMHKSVDVLKLQMEPGRRHRRLLPEGLRGRGLRPRRHQGHPRLERGPRPGQDRPPRPPAEARRPRHRLRRRRRERRRPLGGGAEARHHARVLRRDRLRRRPLRRHDHRGRRRDRQGDRRRPRPEASPASRPTRAPCSTSTSTRTARPSSTPPIAQVKDAVEALKAVGLEPELVSGGGTGSYYFESNSGVYNELQCGSYAFMDADYGRIHDKDGNRIDQGEWENALFILTSVMSHAKPDQAVCDAGLKAQSVDSGLPFVYGRDDVKYIKCSDEHGVIEDKGGVLEGQREAQARPRPLRPDLQRARLVRRRPQRQGRDHLAGQRPRQGLLTTARAPFPEGRNARLSYGLETWRAVVFRQQAENKQSNNARTCAHLLAATAASRRRRASAYASPAI